MAEFCLECFNRFNKMKLTEKEVLLEDDLCEGCGEVKPCVIAITKSPKKVTKNFLKNFLKKTCN